MDLNAVRMFVAAVQAGSLSAAAARLDMALPTLSRRIRELEAELNVRLFERNARGVKLTDAGTRLYEHASRGIDSLEDAARAVPSDEAQLRGTLRLSIPPSCEPWWDLIAAFQRNHPQVRVSVFTTERRVDLVEDGIEVALRVGEVVHDSMVGRRLFSYHHVLVASPQLLARVGEPTSPEGLRHMPCGVWQRSSTPGAIWQLGDQRFAPPGDAGEQRLSALARSRHRGRAADRVAAVPGTRRRAVRRTEAGVARLSDAGTRHLTALSIAALCIEHRSVLHRFLSGARNGSLRRAKVRIDATRPRPSEEERRVSPRLKTRLRMAASCGNDQLMWIGNASSADRTSDVSGASDGDRISKTVSDRIGERSRSIGRQPMSAVL